MNASMDFGLPVIEANLNGRMTRLSIETGSTGNMMSDAVVKDLNLSLHEFSAPAGTVSRSTGKSYRYMAKLKFMQLGRLLARDDVWFFDIPDWNSAIEKTDGALGAKYLVGMDIEFDLAHGKINFWQKAEDCGDRVVYWTDEFVTIPFALNAGLQLNVSAELDGHRMPVLIETGINQGILLSTAAKHIFGRERPAEETAPADDRAQFSSLFHTLSIGGITFHDVDLSIVPDRIAAYYSMIMKDYGNNLLPQDKIVKPDLTIGMAQLSKLRLFIAYSQHKIYATAANAAAQ